MLVPAESVRDDGCEHVCAWLCSCMFGSRGVCTGENAEKGCVSDCMHYFSNRKLNIFLVFSSS